MNTPNDGKSLMNKINQKEARVEVK